MGTPNVYGPARRARRTDCRARKADRTAPYVFAGQRGFTLVELMIVVVIVSILATLGVYGTRRYISSSKTGEAIQLIGSIKAAQEAYKDETFQYLDVSTAKTLTSNFYPTNPKPGQTKVMWGGGTDDVAKNWATLGVNPGGPVLFVYACSAGGVGDTPTNPGTDITVGSWPTTALGSPWYVVKAKADLSSGGKETVYVAPSFTTQIFSANEGE
ncbi:MAG TPA: type II secretion system protein [Polyangiaceae bacterium]|nr:type II secretion system protein [Polyangiaceae bacterium]